ncbi:DUF6080 domain-containing protein [Chryseobacterium polytrichastri]|uniref:Dolichyl-phosphate-mannose-protein mannosyltransferase n=1 Tax=Chryseobacterium polytrichastri TaxID=1302687 RepID=A0A1M7A9X2_9FLAO|nr:DUF6080 domain-containing protein [Chryseobacterium polytrichastri]SHL39517.1 hypothetical protein SAMN05444267_101722 [Chryseobacterium polytrichastri]
MVFIATIKSKFNSFFKLILPYSYSELGVFTFFIITYGILGWYIALDYRIIFDERIPWDAYFSFDNRSIVMTGGSFERHPLSYYFFNWIREIALYLSDGKTNAVFRLALAWMSTLMVSLSMVQIFKYLKNIINLPLFITFLIIIFFGTFSTPIILSFTPENFTYTLFLLTLFNHYAAIKTKKEEKIPTIPLILAGVSIGGLTITNIVKVFVPIAFEKDIFRNWKKFGNAALRVTLTLICFILLYLNRINFKYENIFSKTNSQYEKFSNVKSTPIWDMILSYFFGGNILFPSFIIRNKNNMKGFDFKALLMDTYTSWLPYVFILILLILVFWSYIKNFKNKFVQILMISFFIDIIIHCIMKFGLHTAYIYGGHFVFVYPLLLGWLFYSYKSFPKILSFLTVTVSILFVYLLLNNYVRMTEFFWFLNQYYQ